MAMVIADRVQETTSTTGTGALTLLGAVTGYQTFSAAIGNTNTTYYTIDSGLSEWEVGIGTVSAGALSRDTVLASSNTGALVNFSAGTKKVFCDYPASHAVQGHEGLIENSATINSNYTITTGSNAISAGPITIAAGATVTVPAGSVWTIV